MTADELGQYAARIDGKPDSVALFDADEVARLMAYIDELHVALALGRDCYQSLRYRDQGDPEPAAFAVALRTLGFLPRLDSLPNDQ